MKANQLLKTTMLLLLPVAFGQAQGQREQEKQPEQKQQQAKPAQQPKPAQQAKPAQQQQPANPAQQPQHAQQQQPAQPARQEQRAQQQQAKPAQQEQQQQAKPAKQEQRAQQQQQARPAQQQQRAQQPQQLANRTQPATGHGRIPDDRFRASFGRGHTFRVNRDERRFQYGGYWFNMVDAWPAAWLYTDNVYVDYRDGGYFLCDPVHPGVYISINIG
jgi:outer membrane biosynthesis protein TonB